jgi:CHAT domain-containing protein
MVLPLSDSSSTAADFDTPSPVWSGALNERKHVWDATVGATTTHHQSAASKATGSRPRARTVTATTSAIPVKPPTPSLASALCSVPPSHRSAMSPAARASAPTPATAVASEDREQKKSEEELSTAVTLAAATLLNAATLAGAPIPRRLLAVPNPALGLDAAEEEVRKILGPQDHLFAGNIAVLKHLNAGRDMFLKRILSYDEREESFVLHFSGHVKAGSRLRWLSAMRMHDGWLSAAKIAQISPLDRCRLAVLSCCESGLSRTSGCDMYHEQLSVAAALLAAGVPQVVCSLWTTSDLATGIFLQRFYAELKSQAGNVGEAVRRAQEFVRSATSRQVLQFSWRPAETIWSVYKGISADNFRLRGGGLGHAPPLEVFDKHHFVRFADAFLQQERQQQQQQERQRCSLLYIHEFPVPEDGGFCTIRELWFEWVDQGAEEARMVVMTVRYTSPSTAEPPPPPTPPPSVASSYRASSSLSVPSPAQPPSPATALAATATLVSAMPFNKDAHIVSITIGFAPSTRKRPRFFVPTRTNMDPVVFASLGEDGWWWQRQPDRFPDLHAILCFARDQMDPLSASSSSSSSMQMFRSSELDRIAAASEDETRGGGRPFADPRFWAGFVVFGSH